MAQGWPVVIARRTIRLRNLRVEAGAPLPASGGWQSNRALHQYLREALGEDVLEVRTAAGGFQQAQQWVERGAVVDTKQQQHKQQQQRGHRA